MDDIEERRARYQRAAERFCAMMNLPPPEPYTREQVLAHDEAMRAADAQLDALIARRAREIW